MKVFLQLLVAIAVPFAALAADESKNKVKWSGIVYDLPETHTTDHAHALIFQEADSKKLYDIVESSEVEKLHHETNKNYRVEVEGYLTSKFLFWGGNLVVSKFKVLEELDEVALSSPPVRRSNDFNGRK